MGTIANISDLVQSLGIILDITIILKRQKLFKHWVNFVDAF